MLIDCLNLVLAHGADPRPISIDEAAANLVKFFVTVSLALMMTYPVLAPLFPQRGEPSNDEQPADAVEPSDANAGLVGWVALGLLLVLSMAWWLTRTSIVELNTEAPLEDHRHTQEQGGQLAMWADFHAEVSRIESGEVRVYLTDAYNRPIAARFFDAEVWAYDPDEETTNKEEPAAIATATPTLEPQSAQTVKVPLPAEATQPNPTVSALNETYRFTRMSREAKAYRVKVFTPGWSVTLKFVFDDEGGRRSLPIWCGTP